MHRCKLVATCQHIEFFTTKRNYVASTTITSSTHCMMKLIAQTQFKKENKI